MEKTGCKISSIRKHVQKHQYNVAVVRAYIDEKFQKLFEQEWHHDQMDTDRPVWQWKHGRWFYFDGQYEWGLYGDEYWRTETIWHNMDW